MADEPVVRRSTVVVPDGADPRPAAFAQAQRELGTGNTIEDLQVSGSVLADIRSGDQKWSFSYQEVPPGSDWGARANPDTF
jgi:hypothetical protein